MKRLLLAVVVVLALVAAAAGAGATGTGPPPLEPNDPGWSGQWGLRLMGVPQVWQQTNPDSHPLIATVDTGVDPTFPDLRDVLVPGWSLVDNDADTSDTAGHGTDVAIVIAANANNNYGIAGACPMCRVMPVKISNERTASPKMISAGIRWAVDHGARIIIVSMVHTGAVDPSEQPAVDYATSHGAILIASAGNNGDVTPHYPAALPGVVSVAATDQNDQLYPWATHGSWVDLAAPGCEYGAEMCGASYAPPLVAAAVGVLIAAGHNVTPVAALDALRATAHPVNGIDGGRIDVLAAARALGIMPQPTGTVGFAQQLDLESGRFAEAYRKRVQVSQGPLTIVLTRPKARSCTMALRSKSGAYVTWRSTPTQLAISASVEAGVYTLGIACRDSRSRPYSLLVNGLLPLSTR